MLQGIPYLDETPRYVVKYDTLLLAAIGESSRHDGQWSGLTRLLARKANSIYANIRPVKISLRVPKHHLPTRTGMSTGGLCRGAGVDVRDYFGDHT